MNDRILVKIIKDLSEELEFQVDFLCFGWLLCLKKYDERKYILGYDWELNTSTSQLIAKDKSACYEVLNANKIPTVEHKLYLGPQRQSQIGQNGNWSLILTYAKENNYKIICKANMGTGGNDVFKINNQLELETIVHKLFLKYDSVCLCPTYDISREFRVIILDNTPQLIYEKIRPNITGNGKSTVLELIQKKYSSLNIEDFYLSGVNLLSILDYNITLELSWKHNLGKGAKPYIVTDSKLLDKLTEIAINAAKVININFTSVDIVEYNKKLFVMEINSGVMMEFFAKESIENYNIAKDIYKKAIIKMLEIK